MYNQFSKLSKRVPAIRMSNFTNISLSSSNSEKRVDLAYKQLFYFFHSNFPEPFDLVKAELQLW